MLKADHVGGREMTRVGWMRLDIRTSGDGGSARTAKIIVIICSHFLLSVGIDEVNKAEKNVTF